VNQPSRSARRAAKRDAHWRSRNQGTLAQRIRGLFAELTPKLPDADPDTLKIIVERMCEGPDDNRVFFTTDDSADPSIAVVR